jgi:ubiquinone/menaquinone biosynthesis C-methylase UbiE
LSILPQNSLLSKCIELKEQSLMHSATTDDLRAELHGMWASVAPSWEEHADYIDARGAQLTAEILERSAPHPGERVLELACGPGGLGIAAAERVAPGGEVVLSDVAAEMTAIAAARADAAGVENVATLELDIERIDQPDASYDLVLCREGLMFAPDPARAADEIRRVLRPGGRAAIAVWGPRERNPWLGIVLDSVAAQLGRPTPPPSVPGPFSLDDADDLAGLLRDAGLVEVTVDEVEVPMSVGSFEEWWARTSALAGPLSKMLASLPDEAAGALRARVREAARPYETPAGLAFPGVTLLATARRAR